MANKRTKRCATSCVIREMQIKMRTTTHLLEQPEIQNTDNTKAGKDAEQQEPSFIAGGNAKWYSHLWKTIWHFLTKLRILSPYDSATALLSIYSKKLKSYSHRKTCTWMFRAALLMTTKNWKQPRCISVGKWINCDTFRQWNIGQC